MFQAAFLSHLWKGDIHLTWVLGCDPVKRQRVAHGRGGSRAMDRAMAQDRFRIKPSDAAYQQGF